MSTTTRETKEATSISGVTVPDSKLAREAADVLADRDPKSQRMNFCSVIRGSQWKAKKSLSGRSVERPLLSVQLTTLQYRTSESENS